MIQVNAIGDACPLPVIKTKKALSELSSGQLEVLVDNEIAVQNIQRYANSAGCTFACTKTGDQYVIHIEKQIAVQEIQVDIANDSQSHFAQAPSSFQTIVVLPADTMGSGDDALGAILMKGFVFALTQLDVLPSTVLLYNTGARLAVNGAASLNDLLALEKAGVRIMTCGTCLNHFGIAEQLAVGEVTNMYSIIEEMRQADRIIRP